jgi:outer membrane protein assembly factor BamB
MDIVKHNMNFSRAAFLFFVLGSGPLLRADWPQASGPNGNFVTPGNAPTQFSVTTGQNVLWRSPLPSTGQGAVIVVKDRAFVTSHEPIKQDTETGAGILGLCFDGKTGKELWRREIPGTRTTDLSSLFSDNTAASPVANADSVAFANVGGTIKCFDFHGKEKWTHTWTPFGRHHSRQHEPVCMDNKFLFMHAPRTDLPLSATTKEGARKFGRVPEVWTRLQAFNCETGERIWTAQCGTSVHSTSIAKRTKVGWQILTGRGGGHQPPEEPYGLSLVDAKDGSSVWDIKIKNYPAAQSAAWNQDVASLFAGKEHHTVDIKTGEFKRSDSLVKDVSVCKFIDGKYVTETHVDLPHLKKAITNQSNCLVGKYHFFLAHDDFLIGRVHIDTGRVEYLQVPVQVVRNAENEEKVLWQDATANDMKNADGFTATQDRRNAGNGWGHVSAASPIVIGDHIYMPTMIGMVYVLKWNAPDLNESALVSVSDLGPAGQTWSLSSLSYSDDKIYARTLKELICIGVEEGR